MRWELRGCLGAADLSLNETEDLVLAVSEAANNAVEHALQRPHRGSYGLCGEPRKHPALPRCWPGFLTTTRTRLRTVL
jgi:hypothetical protein